MADNPTIDNGALTDFQVAGDDVGGSIVQIVKIAYGPDGSMTVVDVATGLPVQMVGATPVDFDTTGATVNRLAFGIIVPSATGPVLVPGDGVSGLKTQITTAPPVSRTTDAIAAADMGDAIIIGGVPLFTKFFSATVAASQTDVSLVALVASKKIRVIALAAQCAGTATDILFESGTATRKHKIPAGANGGQILPPNKWGWFETAAGEALTVTTGAGSSSEITGTYVEV